MNNCCNNIFNEYCNDIFNDEPEKEKKNDEDDEEQRDFLIYHEIPPKQLKDYLARIKQCRPKPKKHFEYVQKPQKRYYEPGIVAKIDIKTTDNDLCKLLRHGVRTLLVQTAYASTEELEQIMLKINTAIDNFMMETPYNTPIGLAVEVKGEKIRTARLRNSVPQEIKIGKLMVLTTNEDYRFVSVKEVIYVYNLWKYMCCLKVGDVIFMNGNQIQLRIVKIINKNITLCIEKGEYVESYMDVALPCCLCNKFQPSNDDCEDIDFAVRNNAYFLVVPHIRDFCWLKMYKKYVETFDHEMEIAGYLPDCLCSMANSYEQMEIIRTLDVIWIPDFFKRKHKPLSFVVVDKVKRILRCAKQLQKPIVAGIPIITRKDFNRLENHEILKEIDSMLIEKSPVTKTFPIIAKKLQPLSKNYCTGVANPVSKRTQRTVPDKGMLNCLNYTLQTIPCQGIVITSTVSIQSITSLSASDVYCPVIAVVLNERIAKSLNIRRNVKTVVFQCMGDNEGKEDTCIKHGITYGRDQKLFWEGDFVIAFHDAILRGTLTSILSGLYVQKEKIVINHYLSYAR